MRKIGKDFSLTIPGCVLRSQDLGLLDKFILTETIVLAKKRDYAWATNAHFADRFGVSESSVSRSIKQLIRLGYLRSEMVIVKKGTDRRLYPLKSELLHLSFRQSLANGV